MSLKKLNELLEDFPTPTIAEFWEVALTKEWIAATPDHVKPYIKDIFFMGADACMTAVMINAHRKQSMGDQINTIKVLRQELDDYEGTFAGKKRKRSR